MYDAFGDIKAYQERFYGYISRKLAIVGANTSTGWYSSDFTRPLTDWDVRRSEANATYGASVIQYLQTHPDLLKKLLRIYAVDYVALKFELPDWVVESCPGCVREILHETRRYREAAVRFADEL